MSDVQQEKKGNTSYQVSSHHEQIEVPVWSGDGVKCCYMVSLKPRQ